MNWRCPYCGSATTITSPNRDENWIQVDIAQEHLSYSGRVGLRYQAIACPNKDCKKMYFRMQLKKTTRDRYGSWNESNTVLNDWSLLPESTAKPQPDYIPAPIVQDYTEACRIKDLSPKASAALARRCLQGIIRDFWGIKKATLKLEIDELEKHVSTEVWEAIDAVRSVGNIGAHMEEDVNLIIEIEPDEATLLINLIEDLFEDWYVVRHERKQRQLKLKNLAMKKQEARKKKSK